MQATTKYVGLDVHQATTVSTVRTETGRVIQRGVLATEACALVGYLSQMRGTVHVTFEEGTQAQWLHDLLSPVVDRVVVCNRRGEPRLGNKSDHADADRLSELLRLGGLRAVDHGMGRQATLKELTRAYRDVVRDMTRTKQRIKALYRARGIQTPGQRVYSEPGRAEWLDRLQDPGARIRATTLYAQLDQLDELKPRVKTAMVVEARRDRSWRVLKTVPFMGPVRVSLLMATMRTPWRFRTKRNLWAYSGLAVVTASSADYRVVGGQVVRSRRPPLTRGLNRNHNRVLKEVFKGAALAASRHPGELRDLYEGMIGRGMRPAMARVTLARKLAAITLRLWKTGEAYDPTQLTMQA